MADLTLDEIARLRKIAESATPGPWKWWTSCSWRRLKRDDHGITQTVAEPFVASDGHPDLTISDEDMAHTASFSPDTTLRLLDMAERMLRAEAERDEIDGARILNAAALKNARAEVERLLLGPGR